jgi:hypothetical protein
MFRIVINKLSTKHFARVVPAMQEVMGSNPGRDNSVLGAIVED